jgi:methyltransferase (TIGR00027 family)
VSVAPAASKPAIRDVADTARWVALYRAVESERPDAHFHDPYARQLAGDHGVRIHASLPRSMRNAAWSVVARTVLIDQMIQQQIAAGVTLVVNLAAGLDTRPYRLSLPPTLTWIEVDRPAILEEKAVLLAEATPNCRVERVPLDLSLDAPRREFLAQVRQRGRRTLVITEGLLMYLAVEHVTGLARDLAGVPAIEAWIADVISPGLLRMIERDWGQTLLAGDASMHFAPAEGSAFFEPLGWHTAECHSTFVAARTLRRLPWFLRLLSHLPGSDRYHPDRPWSGICLLKRNGAVPARDA